MKSKLFKKFILIIVTSYQICEQVTWATLDRSKEQDLNQLSASVLEEVEDNWKNIFNVDDFVYNEIPDEFQKIMKEMESFDLALADPKEIQYVGENLSEGDKSHIKLYYCEFLVRNEGGGIIWICTRPWYMDIYFKIEENKGSLLVIPGLWCSTQNSHLIVDLIIGYEENSSIVISSKNGFQ